MKLASTLGYLALASVTLAVSDDAGAGSPSRCHEAEKRGDWREALVLCQASYARDPRPSYGLALARAKMSLDDDDGALELARRAEAGEMRAEALLITGLVLDRRGDAAPARAALGEALALFRARGESPRAARAAYALAGSHWRRAGYREALAELDASMRDAEAGRDARMIGYVALMRGDVLRALGDARGAEGAFREADAALAATRGDLVYVRLKMGMLHRDAGRLSLARQAFEEALAISRETGLRDIEAAAHLNLAYTAHLEGDALAGLGHIAELLAPRDVAYLYNRALLESDRGALVEAASLLDEAAAVAGSDEWAWDVAYERGRIAERTGDMAGAERAYRTSIAVVERMRDAVDLTELQSWVLRRRRAPYEALFAMLARAGRTPEALEALEAFTARSFLDSLVRAEGAAGDALAHADAIGALWRGLRKEAVNSELGPRLGEREILVHVEAQGSLWVVHRGRGGEFALADHGDAAPARALAERLAADPDDEAAAGELGALLIPERVAAGDDLLYVVPTGRFLSVPYAALRRGSRRLVDERPVALAPSLRALAASTVSARSDGALVLADADGTLPAAREEAAQVGRLLGVAPLTLADATQERLLAAPSRRVLHVATHAGIDASGAWLRLHDGRWTARDVLASNVRADVVVLASCSSASTRHEEMWGSLAAAFLANGSGAVIATLGSVDDADARAVVTSLYRNGVTDDPVRALAAAQRELARSVPPRRWASFVAYSVAAPWHE
ncbi:CHAT domain-containing protein [Sorangium sp. So ce1153]|uniref:CHAT domain-containing protein n=1 Tax=Sorangium sp. So ce1153 TaxID=3133333 RepID=UPI003F5F3DC9